MSTTRRQTAAWWWLAFRLWLGLFAAASLIYALGGSGLRSRSTGGTIDFNRSADVALLRINDSLAFAVSPAKTNTLVSLSRYALGSLPFSPLLGRYEQVGAKMPQVTHQHGDWVYLSTPQFVLPGQPQAYNLRTGETITGPPVPKPANYGTVDLRTVPQFVSRDLLGSPADKLPAPEQLAQRYPALSTISESTVVFAGGFLLVGAALLLLWPFARRRVVIA